MLSWVCSWIKCIDNTFLQDVYKALGDTVNQTKLEHMRAQMAGFKEKLEEFAIKHRYVKRISKHETK